MARPNKSNSIFLMSLGASVSVLTQAYPALLAWQAQTATAMATNAQPPIVKVVQNRDQLVIRQIWANGQSATTVTHLNGGTSAHGAYVNVTADH